MGVTRERLEAMSDRELECMLAKIFHRHDKLREFEVRGEFLCPRLSPRDADPSVNGHPVPRYITTWEGFGQALLDIEHCNFNVELYCSAERYAPRRAVVTQRWNEQKQRGEASHDDLRRALALAAILVMYEAWYETD